MAFFPDLDPRERSHRILDEQIRAIRAEATSPLFSHPHRLSIYWGRHEEAAQYGVNHAELTKAGSLRSSAKGRAFGEAITRTEAPTQVMWYATNRDRSIETTATIFYGAHDIIAQKNNHNISMFPVEIAYLADPDGTLDYYEEKGFPKSEWFPRWARRDYPEGKQPDGLIDVHQVLTYNVTFLQEVNNAFPVMNNLKEAPFIHIWVEGHETSLFPLVEEIFPDIIEEKGADIKHGEVMRTSFLKDRNFMEAYFRGKTRIVNYSELYGKYIRKDQ